jgi:hypothetical protein
MGFAGRVAELLVRGPPPASGRDVDARRGAGVREGQPQPEALQDLALHRRPVDPPSCHRRAPQDQVVVLLGRAVAAARTAATNSATANRTVSRSRAAKALTTTPAAA